LVASFFYVLFFSFIWMVIAYGLYLVIKNGAIVDIFWTLGITLSTILLFWVAVVSSFALYFVLILMMIWGARLTFLVVYRLITHKVDGRYEALEKGWKTNIKRRYFWFFMFQGASIVIFMIPMMFIASYKDSGSVYDIIGTLLMVVGLCGVILSDFQLQSFIKSGTDRSQVCEKGLWYYSRHPNYFFEWVYWVGIFFFAISVPFGFIAVISPLALLLTLLFVTGIPPAEKRALETKGENYKQYQASTSSFVPWFKK